MVLQSVTLLELLEKRGLSQTQYATLAGTSQASVNRWVNGKMAMGVKRIWQAQTILRAKALLDASGKVQEWIPEEEGEI